MTVRTMLYHALPLVAAAALWPARPVSADPELDAARARWQQAALGSYEYGYHKFCECHRESPPETVVTVAGNAVTRVRHRPAGSTVEVPALDRIEYYWTVEGLFDLVDSALERGVEVRVAYDATLGYPREIYIDYDTDFIGDELDLRLTRVAAVPPGLTGPGG
jgi:hypothetical protein